MKSAPRSMPSRAKPGSHEGGNISATSPPHSEPPLLQRSFFVSGSVVHAPPSRLLLNDLVRSAGLLTTAAAVVITLNVEPGGNVCCVATRPRGGKPLASGLS